MYLLRNFVIKPGAMLYTYLFAVAIRPDLFIHLTYTTHLSKHNSSSIFLQVYWPRMTLGNCNICAIKIQKLNTWNRCLPAPLNLSNTPKGVAVCITAGKDGEAQFNIEFLLRCKSYSSRPLIRSPYLLRGCRSFREAEVNTQ